MATRVAILGLPNTGKSMSRQFIYEGEKAFVIAPSSKLTHLFTSEGKKKSDDISIPHEGGKPVKKLSLTINGIQDTEFMSKNGIPSYHELIKGLVSNSGSFEVKATGNYVVCSEVKYTSYYQLFVSKYMLDIDKIFLADFTHWISFILR